MLSFSDRLQSKLTFVTTVATADCVKKSQEYKTEGPVQLQLTMRQAGLSWFDITLN